MDIITFSVNRPIACAMFFLAACLLGFVGLYKTELSLLPRVESPGLTVITTLSGFGAQGIERIITRPLEEATGGMPGIKSIKSYSEEGKSTLILTLEYGADIDALRGELGERLKKVGGDFPNDARGPFIHRHDPSGAPAVVLALSGPDPDSLEGIAKKRIIPKLKRLEGVGEVEFAGTPPREIHLRVDRNAATIMGVDINALVRDLSVSTINQPAGNIGTGEKTTVTVPPSFEKPWDFNKAIIWPPGALDQGLPLERIAQVSIMPEDSQNMARLNGQSLGALYIMKTGDANAVALAGRVSKELEEIRKSLPRGIELETVFDQYEPVMKKLKDLWEKGLMGAILAGGVLFFFLRDIRATLLIFIAIPISLLLTFNIMYFQGITVNIISLSGLALGLGMLVDNGIVVLESTAKKRGCPLSIIAGTKSVALPVFASTLTTVAVFWPLLYVDQDIKLMYSDLFVTVSSSLLASWLVAVTIIPSFFALGRKNKLAGENSSVGEIGRQANWEEEKNEKDQENSSVGEIGRQANWEEEKNEKDQENSSVGEIGRQANWEEEKNEKGHFLSWAFELLKKGERAIYKHFQRISRFTVKRPVLPLIIALLIILGGILAWPTLGQAYLIMSDTDSFNLFVELASGTKIQVTDEIVGRVEEILKTIPDVDKVMSKISPWSGQLTVKLKSPDQRTMTLERMLEIYKSQIDAIPLCQVFFASAMAGGDMGDELQISVRGWEERDRMNLSYAILGALNEIKGEDGKNIFTDTAIRARAGRREYLIKPDRQKLFALGGSVMELAYSVRSQLTGPVVNKLTRGDSDELVRLILEEKDRLSLDDLKLLPIGLGSGKVVPLGQVADFEFAEGPVRINREEGQRVTDITARFSKISLSQAALLAREKIDKLRINPGMEVEFTGSYKKMQKTGNQMKMAVLLTVLLVLMILASLYESFAMPYLVAITIPTSAGLVILWLKLMNYAVDMSVYIGLVVMVGIVVNNAIVLVDAINRNRLRGCGPIRAAMTAARQRLRPIMMTTITTVMGMIPLIFTRESGEEMWNIIGWIVTIGLLGSTGITLFVIPGLYIGVIDMKKRLNDIFLRFNPISSISSGLLAIFPARFLTLLFVIFPVRFLTLLFVIFPARFLTLLFVIFPARFLALLLAFSVFFAVDRAHGATKDYLIRPPGKSKIQDERGFVQKKGLAREFWDEGVIYDLVGQKRGAGSLFDGVPIDHWIYDEIDDMAQETGLSSFADGIFYHGETCSWYEMALSFLRVCTLENKEPLFHVLSGRLRHKLGTAERIVAELGTALEPFGLDWADMLFQMEELRRRGPIIEEVAPDDPLQIFRDFPVRTQDKRGGLLVKKTRGSVLILNANGPKVLAKNGTRPIPGDILMVPFEGAALLQVDNGEIVAYGENRLPLGPYPLDLAGIGGRIRIKSQDATALLPGAYISIKGDIEISHISKGIYKLICFQGMALVKDNSSSQYRLVKAAEKALISPDIMGISPMPCFIQPHLIFWKKEISLL